MLVVTHQPRERACTRLHQRTCFPSLLLGYSSLAHFTFLASRLASLTSSWATAVTLTPPAAPADLLPLSHLGLQQSRLFHHADQLACSPRLTLACSSTVCIIILASRLALLTPPWATAVTLTPPAAPADLLPLSHLGLQQSRLFHHADQLACSPCLTLACSSTVCIIILASRLASLTPPWATAVTLTPPAAPADLLPLSHLGLQQSRLFHHADQLACSPCLTLACSSTVCIIILASRLASLTPPWATAVTLTPPAAPADLLPLSHLGLQQSRLFHRADQLACSPCLTLACSSTVCIIILASRLAPLTPPWATAVTLTPPAALADLPPLSHLGLQQSCLPHHCHHRQRTCSPCLS